MLHRDIKARNILLTGSGEVKLVDFGFGATLETRLGKTDGTVGSACWMAPEIISSRRKREKYDNRVDVWSLGITAIELGDGKPPFESMHPTRALFQIVTNPPPTLYRTCNWSENYIDFIDEYVPIFVWLLKTTQFQMFGQKPRTSPLRYRTFGPPVFATNPREQLPRIYLNLVPLIFVTSFLANP